MSLIISKYSAVKIELPFPNGKLSPNRAKGMHWGATASLKVRQFDDAYLLTKQAMNGVQIETDAQIQIVVTFCEPDRRKRDLDNCLSAAKSAFDGIASAMNVNDKNFNPITIKRGAVVKGGVMIVEVHHGRADAILIGEWLNAQG